MKAENNKRLKEKKNWILLLLKKVAKLLFNRIFYVAVAILVQFGWIMMMVMRLATYSRYVDILLKLVGVVIVLWILNKEINPSYKLAWTILILGSANPWESFCICCLERSRIAYDHATVSL